MISEEVLAEIRERIPITDLVSEYVQLKKAGKTFKGLCPFHQEKTPSFTVSPERETFHCFGCGNGGNLFHFLMKIEGISFPEAVQQLGERVGIHVEAGGISDPKGQERRQRLLEIQRRAAWYYHCLLNKTSSSDPIRIYLQKRQIEPEAIRQFHLGYCPHSDSGLRTYLIQQGFRPKEIETSGIFKDKREFFRGRLLFPIFRSDKKVVGLGGRLFAERDTGPKYLNSPESEVFKKGELFYGLKQAASSIRQTGRAVIAEGYLDVIALHMHGFTQAVAPLGTAFTQHHARLLRRMAEEIILIFDGDSAGEAATFRALEILLTQNILPNWVKLEGQEDPDSFLKKNGRLAFEKKLQERRNLLEDLIDKWSTAVPKGPGNLEKKGHAAGRIKALIEKIPDLIVRNLYLRRLAESMEIPFDWLNNLPQKKTEARAAVVEPLSTEWPAWVAEEEMIFELWLKFPELRKRIKEALDPQHFMSNPARELAVAFWTFAERDPQAITGKYFDVAPVRLLEVLSALTLRPTGPEDLIEAEVSLEETIIRLKEKQLRHELKILKDFKGAAHLDLIDKKIQALSQILKSKERVYGERKN